MFFKRCVSDKEIVDTGMAATLVLLIVGVFMEDDSFMAYAAFALVVNMTFFQVVYVRCKTLAVFVPLPGLGSFDVCSELGLLYDRRADRFGSQVFRT